MDLVKKNPDSQTRVRILFSSRPWNVFVEEFKDCMGFDIHDRTEDVRQVCAYILQAQAPNAQGAREIIRLIEKIFQRARGVFLWVELVMHDLCRHSADCIDRGIGSRAPETTPQFDGGATYQPDRLLCGNY